MNKITFLLLIAVYILSCNNQENEPKISDKKKHGIEESDSNMITTEKNADTIIPKSQPDQEITPIWKYNVIKNKTHKLREPKSEELNATALVHLLNHTLDPQIKLQLLRTSNDTIYVHMPNSNYFTQSIGTTGARENEVIIVYTLTELKGINYVNLDFTEGDHASPGVRSRPYYKTK